jgi:hypothetical protein
MLAMLPVLSVFLLLLLPFLLVDVVYRWCCWLTRKRDAIFLYQAPAMTAGEAYRARDSAQAKEKFNALLDKYFERVEPDEHNGYGMTFKLNWKCAALPNSAWPKQFLKAENGESRLIMFILTEHSISFPSGIVFPIPLKEPTSYNFLKQFSSETPFKMNPQYFSVVIPIGKKGKYAARKPDAEISARLNEVISQASEPV